MTLDVILITSYKDKYFFLFLSYSYRDDVVGVRDDIYKDVCEPVLYSSWYHVVSVSSVIKSTMEKKKM